MTDLHPIEFTLTPDDHATAASARVHIERHRIERNLSDDKRAPADIFAAAMAAGPMTELERAAYRAARIRALKAADKAKQGIE